MRIIYNGVELDIVYTNAFIRDDVMSSDGQTYLYTRWVIDVQAVLNPQATSFNLSKEGQPHETDGIFPHITDKSIRQALMNPRGKLKLISEKDNEVFLESPGVYPCDCKGGPYPRLYPVLHVSGVKTFTVNFRVETYTNEQPGGAKGNPLLLSNRWTITESVDDDHYMTRYVEGEAVFRLDYLFGNMDGDGKIIVSSHVGQDGSALPLSADQFRKNFFFELNAGWKRSNIRVTTSSDGSTLYYSFIDQGLPYGWDGFRFTRIEAFHTSGVHAPSQGEAKMAFFVEEAIPAAFRGYESGGMPGVFGAIAGGAFAAYKRALPIFNENVNVKVWGDDATTRQNLIDMAVAVGTGKMKPILKAKKLPFAPSQASSITRACTHKYVDFSWTIQTGPYSALLGGQVPINVKTKPDITEQILNEDSVHQSQVLIQAMPDLQQPIYPPFDGGTRSTSLPALISQFLEDPGSSPPAGSTIVIRNKDDVKKGYVTDLVLQDDGSINASILPEEDTYPKLGAEGGPVAAGGSP